MPAMKLFGKLKTILGKTVKGRPNRPPFYGSRFLFTLICP
jgi:hypothetical protein